MVLIKQQLMRNNSDVPSIGIFTLNDIYQSLCDFKLQKKPGENLFLLLKQRLGKLLTSTTT